MLNFTRATADTVAANLRIKSNRYINGRIIAPLLH